jgi:hypothetical protein
LHCTLFLAVMCMTRAGSSEEESNFLPRPPQAESVDPRVVHRLTLDEGGMRGASGAVLSKSRGLLVWGEGELVTTRAITRIDLVTGEQTRLFTAPGLLTVFPAPDGAGLWFLQNDTWFHLDDATGRATPVSEIFGEAFRIVDEATRSMRYYKTAVQQDGALLLEWSRYEEIPFLFGRTREAWSLRPRAQIPSNPSETRDVYSRVWLQHPSSPAAAMRFEVDYKAVLHHPREASRIEGRDDTRLPDGGFRAPVSNPLGVSGDLSTLAIAGSGLVIRPFELRRHPRTFAACGVDDHIVDRSATMVMTSNISNAHCARVTGVHVEHARDGRHVRTLTHDLGMPGTKLLKGDLLVFAGARDTAVPSAISLWDVREGRVLMRLRVPNDVGRQTNIVAVALSPDLTQVFAVSGYPRPVVMMWPLPPEHRVVARREH